MYNSIYLQWCHLIIIAINKEINDVNIVMRHISFNANIIMHYCNYE